MNILVLGATGFIGSHVTHALINQNYQVTCGVRDTHAAKKWFPKAKVIQCNFLKDKQINTWKKRLEHIDIIINCIGIFYHPNKEIIWDIHYHTPRAIFEAAFVANVKKIIHISALNTELYPVDYAKSKKAAEDNLLNSGVPAIILKPSLVYGTGSSGGMKLFRSLASLPLVLPVPGEGNQKFQPIHIDDLTKAIIQLIINTNKKNIVLPAVSINPVSLLTILKTWRKWLGLAKPFIIHIPLQLIRIINIFNDLIPYSTINNDALTMLAKNNIVSKAEALHFQEVIGFAPKDFVTGLLATSSETQDRWYNIFITFKPILKLSLAFMWIASALTSAWLFPQQMSYQLLTSIGAPSNWQPLLLYGASAINLLIGLALLLNFKPRVNYILQFLIISCYTFIITWKLPQLWLEPFGPIVKNIPILTLILFLFCMEREE